MNDKLLRSIMLLHDDTNKTLAEYLGISEKSVSDKIKERGTEFKQSEIAAIMKRYALTDEQTRAIFFN
jgi:predicted DNA binding protein